MNRKQQIKWRFRRFRLRSAVFMRRNGLYLALAAVSPPSAAQQF